MKYKNFVNLGYAAAKDGEERIPAGEIFLPKNQDIVIGSMQFIFE